MKKLLDFGLWTLAFGLLSAQAQPFLLNPALLASNLAAPAAGPPPPECTTPSSPILHETFEGTGYSTAGWFEGGTGTCDEDYTTSPAPLVGAQSLFISTASNQPRYILNGFTSSADVYYRFKFRIAAYPNDEATLISDLTAGEAEEGGLKIATDGKLRVMHGGTHSSYTADAIPLDTTCTIWYRHAKGTGANGVGSAAFDSNGCVRPTSGNKFTSTASGTATANLANVGFGLNVFSGVNAAIFDELVLDDVAID